MPRETLHVLLSTCILLLFCERSVTSVNIMFSNLFSTGMEITGLIDSLRQYET